MLNYAFDNTDYLTTNYQIDYIALVKILEKLNKKIFLNYINKTTIHVENLI